MSMYPMLIGYILYFHFWRSFVAQCDRLSQSSWVLVRTIIIIVTFLHCYSKNAVWKSDIE